MFDRYYNLAANPFQLTPDARFYFESATHRKALSYLGYGLAQGEGFIVITGEIGSGKTTLVGHLMATIDKSRLTAATIVTSALDADDLVGMAAESFGIKTSGRDKAAMLKAIENFLHDEARAGRRCLLIVDEAQNLSINALEELRMLSNFQLGGQALLQTFLLGQPEFRDRVQSEARLEQLRQRIIATHHLGAMERAEVEPYIIHRLSKVGWDGRPDITEEAIDRLYDETGGIPRKVNTLLSRLLLLGAVEQTDLLDDAMLAKVIADRDEDDAEQPQTATPAHVDDSIDDTEEPVPLAEATADEPQVEDDWVELEAIEQPDSELDAILQIEASAGADAPDVIDASDIVDAPVASETSEDQVQPMMEALADEETFDADEPEQASSPYAEWDEPADIVDAEEVDAGVNDAAMGEAATDYRAVDQDTIELLNALQERQQDMDAMLSEMRATVSGLEKRVVAQEDAIKQVLAMLIDWAEHGAPFEKNRAA